MTLRRLGPSAAVMLGLFVSGCLAQQADLVQTRSELDERITALNKKEQELRDKIKQVDALITRQTEQAANLGAQLSELQHESRSTIEGADEKQNKRIRDIEIQLDDRLQKNKSESERRVGDSEKVLMEQLASLKAEYGTRLAALEGGVKDQGRGFEDQAKAGREDVSRLQENLVKLRTRLEETNAAVLEVTKRFEARFQDHDRALGAGEAKAGGFTQQLDQQGRSVTEQMSQFSRALADFKIVLTGLADKLAQQEHVTQELAVDLNRRTDTLAAKADADIKATSSYLAGVNRSLESVNKAVENLGSTLNARIDQQELKLGEVSVAYQSMLAPSQGGARRDAPESGGAKRGGKTNKRVGSTESEPSASLMAQLQADTPAPAAADIGIHSQSASNTVASIGGPDKNTHVDGLPEPPRPGAKEAYESVLIKFRQGDLDGAQRGFTDFLAQYRGSDFAPNAQYWLGECYYSKRDYRRAIEAFTQVRQTYPRSEKVPAALLKASYAYIEVNERSRAASLLREILESYPKSPEAGKAGAKLAQLEKKR